MFFEGRNIFFWRFFENELVYDSYVRTKNSRAGVERVFLDNTHQTKWRLTRKERGSRLLMIYVSTFRQNYVWEWGDVAMRRKSNGTRRGKCVRQRISIRNSSILYVIRVRRFCALSSFLSLSSNHRCDLRAMIKCKRCGFLLLCVNDPRDTL